MANIGKEIHEGIEFEIRSTPLPRLTLNASYSFLNRDINYDFIALPNVSAVNTSITILPTLPRNKVHRNRQLPVSAPDPGDSQ